MFSFLLCFNSFYPLTGDHLCGVQGAAVLEPKGKKCRFHVIRCQGLDSLPSRKAENRFGGRLVAVLCSGLFKKKKRIKTMNIITEKRKKVNEKTKR